MQSELASTTDFVPQSDCPAGLHVAIIMDGNGRWATRRGLPRVAGHRAGVTTARRIVEHAPQNGIRCLTLYAFSSDNWRRPANEVRSLFRLFRAYLRLECARLTENGTRLQVIGRRDRLPPVLVKEIERVERATLDGRQLHLRVAIDYSSRDAITRAAVAAAPVPGAVSGALRESLHGSLGRALSAESGDVDLLIRTGGEKRLSDFLLWESAYAELLFTNRMWPDFNEYDLDAAMAEFHSRERRFGAVPGKHQEVPALSFEGAQ